MNFPNGETLTLLGVSPAQLATPQALNAIGIPLAGAQPDGIVSGTAGNDSIVEGTYADDPDGDFVDNGDAIIDGEIGDDDIILAGGGDDYVVAGDGDDYIEGGTGDDTIIGDSVDQNASVTDTVVVASDDFEDGTEGWIDNAIEIDSGFGEVLGRMDGSDGTVAVEKTFDLPADQDTAVLTFEAVLADSGDEENFVLTIGGETFTFSHTSGNTEAASTQSIVVGGTTYVVDFTPQEPSANQGFGAWEDLVLDVTVTVTNPGDTLTVGFGTTLDQDQSDESLSIDNLEIVTTGPTTGDDEIYGVNGEDTIYGNFGDDIIDGGNDDEPSLAELAMTQSTAALAMTTSRVEKTLRRTAMFWTALT